MAGNYSVIDFCFEIIDRSANELFSIAWIINFRSSLLRWTLDSLIFWVFDLRNFSRIHFETGFVKMFSKFHHLHRFLKSRDHLPSFLSFFPGSLSEFFENYSSENVQFWRLLRHFAFFFIRFLKFAVQFDYPSWKVNLVENRTRPHFSLDFFFGKRW